MCGFIADKEDSNLKNNPNVTQTYIDQIRDDRLSRLLANEVYRKIYSLIKVKRKCFL